ncbi:MAG: acyl-CoA dehydrogenase family protein [Nevskia sp.]|nr:acyl-CoA dehydrogenase family protein [Nevskia sp.]
MSEESVAAVREAAEGLTRGISREYWLQCAKEKKFPQQLWDAMAETGLLGLTVPEEYGGSGGGLSELMALNEVTGRAGIPSMFFVLGSFARMPIIKHGTPEQIRKFVTPTATGEGKMCFGVTEPNAGTNTFRLQTSAARIDKGWRVNGAKVFITGAKESTSMLLIARTSAFDPAKPRNGLSLFIIESHLPGIEFQRLNIDVLGESQYQVFFKDVEIPTDALIGEEGKGMKYLFDGLNTERLVLASMAVGLGNRALDKAVAYARERAPFGTPIGSYQGLQHPMARAKAHLEAARLVMLEAAATFDRGEDAGPLSNMAKLLSSEACEEAVDISMQAHGGYGFDQDYDVVTLWPFARLMRVAPVNNEMILNYIGEHVLGLPRSY